jgi:surface polysaccharide O-acyltransferase-like enzyme
METPSRLISEARSPIASRQHQIANIERLRILSAFGVASFHTHDWFPRSFGIVGFIVLLLTFCAFVVNRPEPYGFGDLAKRKAERLLKPWLFWSAIYGALGLVKVIRMDVPFSDVFSATMFLTGTRIHLWFLPFAFVAALLLVLVHRRMTKAPETYNIAAAVLVGMICVLGCSIVQTWIELRTPLLQWTLGLPAIPLGFAIGRIMILPERKDRRNLCLLVVLSTAAALGVYTALLWLERGAWFDPGSEFIVRYGISTVLVCLALLWPGRLDSTSRTFGSLSYGIYLVHPLVVVFLCQLGIFVQQPLLLLFLVLAISGTITLVFKKTLLRQFI